MKQKIKMIEEALEKINDKEFSQLLYTALRDLLIRNQGIAMYITSKDLLNSTPEKEISSTIDKLYNDYLSELEMIDRCEKLISQ